MFQQLQYSFEWKFRFEWKWRGRSRNPPSTIRRYALQLVPTVVLFPRFFLLPPLPIFSHLFSFLIIIWFCVLLMQIVKIRLVKVRKCVQNKKSNLFNYLVERKPRNVMIIFNHYAITYCFILFAFISTATDENKRPDWKMIFLFPENCTTV